ncbi:hypothetical protein ACFW1F_18185 [Streptomyces bungoensis]|uniref:hypothetical protein n=1 Tax=Streptomyces bungoensis TaxID=285568 RepID=UPI00342A4143
MIALIVIAASITCYVGLARIPQPHQLPSAVVGSRLSMKSQHVLGDSVTVHLEAFPRRMDRATVTGSWGVNSLCQRSRSI